MPSPAGPTLWDCQRKVTLANHNTCKGGDGPIIMFLARSAGNARVPRAYKSSCHWSILSSNTECMQLINAYSCSSVFNSVVTTLVLLKHLAILSITINQVFLFLYWHQTGLTQLADTVIGGSVGPGLSGGQVSSMIAFMFKRVSVSHEHVVFLSVSHKISIKY